MLICASSGPQERTAIKRHGARDAAPLGERNKTNQSGHPTELCVRFYFQILTSCHRRKVTRHCLVSLYPEGMFWKAHVSYSEYTDVMSSRPLQAVKRRPDEDQARHAVEGTPRMTRVGHKRLLMVKSNIPGAYVCFSTPFGVPSQRAVTSGGHSS